MMQGCVDALLERGDLHYLTTVLKLGISYNYAITTDIIHNFMTNLIITTKYKWIISMKCPMLADH